jgi:hypothetical protein
MYWPNNDKYQDFYLNVKFAINVDEGKNPKGKIRALMPGAAGWIKAC